MFLFEIRNVTALNKLVNIPEVKWHSPVHRLDKDIEM
jgi:hypothetical protein